MLKSFYTDKPNTDTFISIYDDMSGAKPFFIHDGIAYSEADTIELGKNGDDFTWFIESHQNFFIEIEDKDGFIKKNIVAYFDNAGDDQNYYP